MNILKKYSFVFTLLLATVWFFSATAFPSGLFEEHKLDIKKSKIEFLADSFLHKVNGEFTAWQGLIHLNPWELTKSSVVIKMDMKGIKTSSTKRDEHLQGADFFDVAQYPEAVFKSKKVTPQPAQKVGDENELNKNNLYDVEGELTLKGVTRTINFPAQIIEDNGKISATAEFKINRKDFNISYRSFLNPIEDDVIIRFQVQSL